MELLEDQQKVQKVSETSEKVVRFVIRRSESEYSLSRVAFQEVTLYVSFKIHSFNNAGVSVLSCWCPESHV